MNISKVIAALKSPLSFVFGGTALYLMLSVIVIDAMLSHLSITSFTVVFLLNLIVAIVLFHVLFIGMAHWFYGHHAPSVKFVRGVEGAVLHEFSVRGLCLSFSDLCSIWRKVVRDQRVPRAQRTFVFIVILRLHKDKAPSMFWLPNATDCFLSRWMPMSFYSIFRANEK